MDGERTFPERIPGFEGGGIRREAVWAPLAMLTIGKYLSPKLFISYGVGLFQRGYSFKLQYDVGRGFKLQTETGVESGGDILYSIER